MKYTESEISTWNTVYTNLKNLFKTHACSQYNHILPLLEQNCGYSENSIPQLQEVSEFLKRKLGLESEKHKKKYFMTIFPGNVVPLHSILNFPPRLV